MTYHLNGHYEEEGCESNMDDADNPSFMFQTFNTSLLSRIASGAIDPVDLAKKELVARGLDMAGNWVGFDNARDAYEESNLPKEKRYYLKMDPFDKADWECFSGCNSDAPMIGINTNFVLIQDGTEVQILEYLDDILAGECVQSKVFDSIEDADEFCKTVPYGATMQEVRELLNQFAFMVR